MKQMTIVFYNEILAFLLLIVFFTNRMNSYPYNNIENKLQKIFALLIDNPGSFRKIMIKFKKSSFVPL